MMSNLCGGDVEENIEFVIWKTVQMAETIEPFCPRRTHRKWVFLQCGVVEEHVDFQ